MSEKESKPKGLFESIFEFQGSLRPANKSLFNPYHNSHYASLEDVLEAALPANALGLYHIFTVEFVDGVSFMVTTLRHVDDKETVEARFPMTADANPQKIVSQTTYYKRTGVATVYGIYAGDDDDGNQAAGHKVNQQQQQQGGQQRSGSNAPPSGNKGYQQQGNNNRQYTKGPPDTGTVEWSINNCKTVPELTTLFGTLKDDLKASYKAAFTKRRGEIDGF